MYAHAVISPSLATSMTVIPIEALVEGNGTEGYVFAPNGTDGVQKIRVKIAQILGKELGVSGLNGVSAVVTEGSSYLTEKSKVKIVE
jgi:hypothetical protein